MTVTDRSTAPHYTWQSLCHGWRLLDRPDLSVIEEEMPPGTQETLHRHARARQLFYLLSGTLEIHTGAARARLSVGQGFEMAPGCAHRVVAPGPDPARFLVISAPSTRADREELGNAV